MRRPLYFPSQVRDAIAEHLGTAIDRAVEGYWSANEDEDTVTGHLGACLRTNLHSVDVTGENGQEVTGTWHWSIDYTKFRGRGPNATENIIGADGIFELRLTTHGGRLQTKSLLFQSKLDWSTDKTLVRQAMLLSTWREAAVVINYTPIAYEVYTIDEVVATRGAKPQKGTPRLLKKALSRHFLECRIGDTDLLYNAKTRRLAWVCTTGMRVATRFSVPNRIRLDIEAPRNQSPFEFDKEISPAEIHNYRMDARVEDILDPLLSDDPLDAKKQMRSLSHAYHPDHANTLDGLQRNLYNRRMQEVNKAYAELRAKKKES